MSLSKKAGISYEKFTKACVAIMLHLKHWSEKLTDQASFGLPLFQTLKISSEDVPDANSLASKLIFQPTI